MANYLTETKDTKQRSKYRMPSKFPVVDGVRYFPGTTREFLQDIKNLPLRGDEVIVVSFPKAGKYIYIYNNLLQYCVLDQANMI